MRRAIRVITLRKDFAGIVERLRKGDRFTVFYRDRPAFQIIPVGPKELEAGALEDDSLYRAEAVGSSTDGLTSVDHDSVLYDETGTSGR